MCVDDVDRIVSSVNFIEQQITSLGKNAKCPPGDKYASVMKPFIASAKEVRTNRCCKKNKHLDLMWT